MIARAQTRAGPDEKASETPLEASRKTDASALGIFVAVVASALIWPALVCVWLYVLR